MRKYNTKHITLIFFIIFTLSACLYLPAASQCCHAKCCQCRARRRGSAPPLRIKKVPRKRFDTLPLPRQTSFCLRIPRFVCIAPTTPGNFNANLSTKLTESITNQKKARKKWKGVRFWLHVYILRGWKEIRSDERTKNEINCFNKVCTQRETRKKETFSPYRQTGRIAKKNRRNFNRFFQGNRPHTIDGKVNIKLEMAGRVLSKLWKQGV